MFELHTRVFVQSYVTYSLVKGLVPGKMAWMKMEKETNLSQHPHLQLTGEDHKPLLAPKPLQQLLFVKIL
jgi:hypothetical protein